MNEVRLFNNGGSQAVRLPKDCRFDPDETVIIKKIGDMVIMIPKDKVDEVFGSGYGTATDDFFADGRDQGTPDERLEL